jgi:hypothetical protein
LIDWLQRVSTILEFAGLLKKPDGSPYLPSVLEGTRYLPSLRGKAWEKTSDHQGIGSSQQITIKRSRINLQILKKTSDQKAKYDLFQRLNSQGSTATPQELRNCVLYMLNKEMFRRIKKLAADPRFVELMQPTERLQDNQGMLDYVTRYLVFTHIEYDRAWDIEEYLDNGLIKLAAEPESEMNKMLDTFEKTLEILIKVGEPDILRRYRSNRFQGKVGQAAFETIFLGVAHNFNFISKKRDPSDYILNRVKSMWPRDDVEEFTRAGLRGTDRIQKTIPFGQMWFSK